MAKDKDTTAFIARIMVGLTPVNRYGDELDESGIFNYTKTLAVQSITELGLILDSIENKASQSVHTDFSTMIAELRRVLGEAIRGPANDAVIKLANDVLDVINRNAVRQASRDPE